MYYLLRASWWVLIVRGLAAIAFGVSALIWPALTLQILVALFGVFALVDGGLALYAALTGRAGKHEWWSPALEGAIGVLAGLSALVWPGLGTIALLYLIGTWAVFTGLAELVMAFRLRLLLANEWLMVAAGVASITFGVLIWLFPGAGALALVTFISAYAIVFGLSLTGLGLRLRAVA